MIFPDVTATVGRTPLVELGRLAAGMPGRVVAKLEMRNPTGSVKDRLGLALVEDAERRGLLKPGMTLVESTGGNTGIGLALAAAVRGYRLILTMPESMSTERVALLRHFGAEVVLTPGILMGEAVAAARRISSETPDAVLLDQFANPANPEVHRRTTAPEIWDGTGGAVDVFVSAVGTGGTITGVCEYIKPKKPSFKAIAVEPTDSAVLSGGKPSPHKIQGIGAGFIPSILRRDYIDEVITVTNDEAINMARRLPLEEGLFVGISSGAAVVAALQVAKRSENAGKLIVVIIPSFGERYLSSILFQELREKAMQIPTAALPA